MEQLQVFTTVPDTDHARRIADALLGRRLAACVQVFGPLTSTYWWHGRIESSQEWLCLIKTSRARCPALIAAIEELHPYDTPEVIAVPITLGSERYLSWIASTLDAADPERRAEPGDAGE